LECDPVLTLRLGDCVEVMASLEGASLAAVVCDPPYGIEFMGKEWDSLTRNLMNPTSDADKKRKALYANSYQGRRSNLPDYSGLAANASQIHDWHLAWLTEAYRVLKPGGVIKAFSGTRTYHRLAAAVVQAGFTEVRLEAWTYGSGFPKSKNVALFMDKRAKAVENRGRAIPMASVHLPGGGKYGLDGDAERLTSNRVSRYSPVTPDAVAWNGWGTALKPAWEPVIVGRKPVGGDDEGNDDG